MSTDGSNQVRMGIRPKVSIDDGKALASRYSRMVFLLAILSNG